MIATIQKDIEKESNLLKMPRELVEKKHGR